jgi:hypothetical protein
MKRTRPESRADSADVDATPRPSALEGVACTNLAALATRTLAVAEFFAAPSAEVPGDPVSWLTKVDREIRTDRDADGVVALASALVRLQASPDWEEFLQALTLDATAASDSRRRQGRLRSLWGVTPIINLRDGVKAERRLGIEAESLVFYSYYVTQDFDLLLAKPVEATRAAGHEVETAFYWLVLMWAMLCYDAFFFFNDRGLLAPEAHTGRFIMGIRHAELALLRRAGKLIYTMPYGADYRTREATMAVSRFNFCMDCPTIGGFCFCDSEAWRPVFHTIAAYATAMLSSGLAMAQLPGSRRLETVVIDPEIIQPSYREHDPGRPLRILHVPNHPHFKGTRYLEAAIARRSADSSVEFVTKSGISNAEVLDLMGDADVVVDQLIGGMFGVTALEAMARGKPVIVYLVDPSMVLAPDECPVINANPDTIDEVLGRIVVERDTLPDIGRRSRAYVERHYSINALADRLRRLYSETAGIDVTSLTAEHCAHL